MTGRRQGTCAGANTPGFRSDDGLPRGGRGFGRGHGFGRGNGHGQGGGMGRGRGFGRGFGWNNVALESPVEAATSQTAEIAVLRTQLADLEAKIDTLLDKD